MHSHAIAVSMVMLMQVRHISEWYELLMIDLKNINCKVLSISGVRA